MAWSSDRVPRVKSRSRSNARPNGRTMPHLRQNTRGTRAATLVQTEAPRERGCHRGRVQVRLGRAKIIAEVRRLWGSRIVVDHHRGFTIDTWRDRYPASIPSRIYHSPRVSRSSGAHGSATDRVQRDRVGRGRMINSPGMLIVVQWGSPYRIVTCPRRSQRSFIPEHVRRSFGRKHMCRVRTAEEPFIIR